MVGSFRWPNDEALRNLVRAREDAVGQSTQAKHRLKAFLLRQGRRYPGRAGWTRPYRRWLADLSFPLAPQHIALQEYRDTIDETERRVDRLTDQVRQLTPAWRWAPVVDALQALRGVSFVTAVGLVTEIGDIRRFTHPRELMAYLGLVPSEYSNVRHQPRRASVSSRADGSIRVVWQPFDDEAGPDVLYVLVPRRQPGPDRRLHAHAGGWSRRFDPHRSRGPDRFALGAFGDPR